MKKRAHEISIRVERTYLTSDSETTIYLLRVRKENRWYRVRKHLQRRIQRAAPMIFRLSIALLAAVLSGAILIPAVEAERGYVAYGGEYLYIAFIFWIVFKLI